LLLAYIDESYDDSIFVLAALIVPSTKNVLCYIYEQFVDYEISLICAEVNISDKCQDIYGVYDKLPVKTSSGMP
jgi:hypothetical protein